MQGYCQRPSGGINYARVREFVLEKVEEQRRSDMITHDRSRILLIPCMFVDSAIFVQSMVD